MKQFFFSTLLVVFCHSLAGQNNLENSWSIIDSLKQALTKTSNERTKADILQTIAARYNYINPDSTIFYGAQAVKMAEKANFPKAKLFAFANMGEAYINTGNFPAALELGLKGIEFAQNFPDTMLGVGPSNSNLSDIYYLIGNNEKSMQYADKMVAKGDYNEMGVAFGYYQKARIYETTNQLDSAYFYINQSLLIFKKIQYNFSPKNEVFPDVYNVRAKVYHKQNKPDLALQEYKSILAINIQAGEAYPTAITYNDIAKYFDAYNLPDSVIYYAEKGLAESNKMSYIKGKLDATLLLAEKYESIDPIKALYYHKLATKTQNSLYGAGNIQVIRDMIEQDEQRLLEIKTKEEAYQNQLKQFMLLGGLTFFSIIALVFFLNNRKSKRANVLLNKQKVEIEKTLHQLKSTQSQLIQSEKMASLGELTAGIAHEIQNPLNFVNNFSEVSTELIEELKEELAEGNTEDVVELADMLTQNLEKINHHGGRASGIVKGMLAHSRSSTGNQKELTDLNGLCDEYLRLAYHGFRAKNKNFNATYITNFDTTLPKLEVVPQDIGRVILNLINNAFYVVNEKGKEGIVGYEPRVKVTTKSNLESIEISVSDNGKGIPKKIIDKIFQPFFTTKPTGQGTGLGLSLSYDIVKAHGGELLVESIEGEGTTFKINLPKNQ